MIIGAGWAGLRAADTLLSSGVENVLVLEASNYVGGRSKSINADGSVNNPITDGTNVPLDVGSEWLYSTGSAMEATLAQQGFLAELTENERYTAIPLETGQFYQQFRNDNGEMVTEILEDADELIEQVWGGFLQFRQGKLDKGYSYEGE